VEFWTSFALFIPSPANFPMPAAIMHFAIPAGHPHTDNAAVHMKPGARTVTVPFQLTSSPRSRFLTFSTCRPYRAC
jgi:hypothetical protein